MGRRLLDMIEAGKYNTLSAAILDNGFRSELYRADGSISKTLGNVPAQKAALLLLDRDFQDEVRP